MNDDDPPIVPDAKPAPRFDREFLEPSLIEARGQQIGVAWWLAAQVGLLEQLDARLSADPWSAAEFRARLESKDCTGLVAAVGWGDYPQRREELAGFCAVRLFPDRLELERFGVAYPFQRLGVATQLVARVLAWLKPAKRERVLASVEEDNLPAQCFLRSLGFRCVATHGDVYRFVYRCPAGAPRRETAPPSREGRGGRIP